MTWYIDLFKKIKFNNIYYWINTYQCLRDKCIIIYHYLPWANQINTLFFSKVLFLYVSEIVFCILFLVACTYGNFLNTSSPCNASIMVCVLIVLFQLVKPQCPNNFILWYQQTIFCIIDCSIFSNYLPSLKDFSQ